MLKKTDTATCSSLPHRPVASRGSPTHEVCMHWNTADEVERAQWRDGDSVDPDVCRGGARVRALSMHFRLALRSSEGGGGWAGGWSGGIEVRGKLLRRAAGGVCRPGGRPGGL